MNNRDEQLPLVLQAIFCTFPGIMIIAAAMVVWIVGDMLVEGGVLTFDRRYLWLIALPAAVLVPWAAFRWTKASIRSGMITPLASPMAVTILLTISTAIAFLAELHLPADARPRVLRVSIRDRGSEIGLREFVSICIAAAGPWIALRFFSRGEAERQQ